MLPTIKKILYATDLSNNSAYAFRHALNLAEKHHAQIAVLHVLEDLTATALSQISSSLNEVQQDKIVKDKIDYTSDWIKDKLKLFCKTESKEASRLMTIIDSIEVREGFPTEEILQTADEFHCDAIIMGTHEKGNIKNTFLGSTAKRVLRRTRKPVFIIPIPK